MFYAGLFCAAAFSCSCSIKKCVAADKLCRAAQRMDIHFNREFSFCFSWAATWLHVWLCRSCVSRTVCPARPPPQEFCQPFFCAVCFDRCWVKAPQYCNRLTTLVLHASFCALGSVLCALACNHVSSGQQGPCVWASTRVHDDRGALVALEVVM